MSEKQLWQIGWQGGMTDGDTGRATVADLLNVEIDRPGQLRPRDEFSLDTTLPDSAAQNDIVDFVHLPIDPSGLSTSLDIVLTTEQIELKPSGQTATVLDLPGDDAVVNESKMFIKGDHIYISKPDGVYIVWYQKEMTKFRAPYALIGESIDNSSTVSASWNISSIRSETPSYAAIGLYEGSQYADDVTDTNTPLAVCLDLKTAETGESSFETDATIGVIVQYKYTNGLLGELSSETVLEFTAVNPFIINYFVYANSSLDDTVESINVYRKIISLNGEMQLDSEYELITTVTVLFGNSTPSSSDLIAGGIAQSILDITAPESGFTLYRSDTSTHYDSDVRRYAGSQFDANRTSGWTYNSTYSIFGYVDSLLMSTGSFTLHCNGGAGGVYYSVYATDTIAAFDYTSGLSPSYVICDTRVLDMGSGSVTHGGGTYVIWQSWDRSLGQCIESSTSSYSQYSSTQSSHTAVSIAPIQAGIVDTGAPTLETLLSVNGVAEGDRSDVTPKAITFAGGRMIGINVSQDGVEKGSRLVYSEFRKYNVVSKASYIDYGTRDDGAGIALAEFGGRLLVGLTSSVYVVDISGGSDLTWREIGSHPKIGIASSRSIVSTPFGIFFADGEDVHLFDGNRIRQTTRTREGADVRETYRALFASSSNPPSLHWRTDLSQLWVCLDEVLVYDVKLDAWHRHDLEEVTNLDLVHSLYNVDGAQYLAWSRDEGLYIYEADDSKTTRDFDWGLDTGRISMGSSEFIKKLKRIYLDLDTPEHSPEPTVENIELAVDGNTTSPIEITPNNGTREVHRKSYSSRGYAPRLQLTVKNGTNEAWNGVVESFGMSYKPKKLK
jgi:hypothetical protein